MSGDCVGTYVRTWSLASIKMGYLVCRISSLGVSYWNGHESGLNSRVSCWRKQLLNRLSAYGQLLSLVGRTYIHR